MRSPAAFCISFLATIGFAAIHAATFGVRANSAYSRIPVYFEKNLGQASGIALFTARAPGYALALTRTGTLISLHGAQRVVSLDFAGGYRGVEPIGEEPLAGRSNYYVGPDPSHWIENVPHFGGVRFPNVYKGIDLVWHGDPQQIEYDLVLRPGADPNQIRLRFRGADSTGISKTGDLILQAAGSEFRQGPPTVWQQHGGERISVDAHYVRLAGGEFGIRLAKYDRQVPLTIDPVLVYSTFLSGSSSDWAAGIAINAQGEAFVVGETSSCDFPGSSGLCGYGGNAFIAKLSADGSTLLFASYFGGAPLAVALDTNGNAYLTGQSGAGVPVTPGALNTSAPVTGEGFVLKFSATGTLNYGTYLGGSGGDQGNAIAVDGNGNAYVAGQTASTDFPVTTGAACSANKDAFVSVLNAAGNALLGSRCLVGSGVDTAVAIALDSGGNVFVGGSTASTDLPATTGVFQTSLKGNANGFVTKLAPDLSISWLTYLGGSLSDGVAGLVLDSAGNVTAAGNETSLDFPTTPGAFQTTPPFNVQYSGGIGFVTRLNPSGTALVYSTLLGAANIVRMAIEPSAGVVYLTGSGATNVSGEALQVTPGAFNVATSLYVGSTGAYIGELSADGSALTFVGYLGGYGASALGRGPDGSLYLAGYAGTDFTTTPGAYEVQGYYAEPAFVTKIDINSPVQCAVALTPPMAEFPSTGGSGSFNIEIANGCPWTISLGGAATTLTPGTPAQGVGPAKISYTISPNISEYAEVGAIWVNTAEFMIRVDLPPTPVCPAPVLDQTSLSFGASETDSQTINVTLPSSCNWNPTTSAAWITATRSYGTNTVSVSVAANSFGARQGTVTINGVAVTVSQAAGSCTATVTGPSSPIPGAGGTAAIQITASDVTCAWGVYGTPAWLSLSGSSSASGVGSALVPFTFTANPTTAQRQTVLSAAGQAVTITQAAGPVASGDASMLSQFSTTIAGGGAADPGDGGPATNAALLDPQAIAWRNGTLYIADGHHRTIRSVTPDGTIHTVAGGGNGSTAGPATSISLTAPEAITFGNDGTLYIADQGANLIWAVDTNGNARIFAGGGIETGDGGSATNAQLSGPSGVAVDGSGNVYISDSNRHRVRKVIRGTITTFAGTGVCGFSGDGKAASVAELCQPDGLAADSAGNLYIADAVNERIRRVAIDGSISTIIGGGPYYVTGGPALSFQLRQPWQVAVDWAGNVFVADTQIGALADIAGNVSSIAGQYPPLANAIAVDVADDVFVASNGVVEEFTASNPFCSIGAAGVSPANPWPANGATDVALRSALSWSPVAGATSYDLYFDTVNPPQQRYYTNCITQVQVNESDSNRTFYWQVVAHTPSGTVSSPVWSFTTQQIRVTMTILAYGGTVTVNPPSADGTYLAGTNVCLTATPNSGWYFVTWANQYDGSPVYCLILYQDQWLDAVFTQQAYPLNLVVQPPGAGTITASFPAINGLYGSGAWVCLTAVANPGWYFSDWGGWIATSGHAPGTGCLMIQIGGESITANFVSSPGARALRFVPVTPCRVADTRNAAGAFGGPAIAAGSSRSFIVPNSSCGVPSTAQAYSLNITAVPAGKLGYLAVWPTGGTPPVVSTLNSRDGRTKADAAIIPAGSNGAISVYATDTTNVVIDINGYFAAAADNNSAALAFYPVTPCRVADTRTATGSLGGPALVGGATGRVFPIFSSNCNIPFYAQAFSLNFTAIPAASKLGYLTVWPDGQSQPLVSTLNAPTGTITANAAIVPVGNNLSIDVYATQNTNLVIDINGYFAPPGYGTGGLSLYNVTPCRVLDTRIPSGSPPFIGKKDVNVEASACAPPSAAQAYVFNATVVPPGKLGYLTLWAQGQTQPVVSTLNALDGAITGNMAIVPTTNGSISAYVTNQTQLLLDLFGYFAP